MLKKIIILAAFVLINAATFSQKSFRLEWQIDDNVYPNRGVVDKEGNTVIVGLIRKPESNQDMDAFIFKMDSKGGYIYDRISEMPDSSISYNNLLQMANGNYFVIGKRGITDENTPNKQDEMVVAIYDQSLNRISTKSYAMKQQYEFIITYSLIQEENQNILAAATAEEKNGQPPFRDLALLRFTPEGDTIKSRYHHFEDNVTVYDLEKIPDSRNYMVLSSPAHSFGFFDCTIINHNLDVTHTNYCSIGNGMWVRDHFTCDYWYSDKTFMMASTMLFISDADKGLGVYRCDTLANINDYIFLNKQNVFDRCAYRGCLALAEEGSIYVAGMEIDNLNCENPDSIELYVVDTGLNQIAYKALGGDCSYDVFGVLTAKNKGAIIFGRNYSPESDCYGNLVVYYVSRDELGLPPVKVLDLENLSIIPWIYPNPAKRIINIQVDRQKITSSSRIRIYNSKGKKVYDYKLPHQGNILQLNIENLEAGIYFFEVICKENFTTNGKFIKQ